MNYDNEAIVRNAYHTAEGNVLDIPGWIDSFTEDGVFDNVTGEESYRGEHLKDVVIAFGQMFPDVHRELHRVNVMGDVVAIELSIQGTFRGPMETPAGVIQPTGAKVNIPCADFFYMKNGKIERFDCYPALNIMLKQRSHESYQTVGIRWAVGVHRCTDANDRSRRDLGEDQEYRRQSSGSC